MLNFLSLFDATYLSASIVGLIMDAKCLPLKFVFLDCVHFLLASHLHFVWINNIDWPAIVQVGGLALSIEVHNGRLCGKGD